MYAGDVESVAEWLLMCSEVHMILLQRRCVVWTVNS